MAVIHIGCFSLLFILWNPRGTPFFYQFCDAQLSRDVVLRSPHFIFGKKREKDLKSDRNNCTSLSLGLSPCESQRAPKRFSLWSSNSFRMHLVISMTIESKDFFATQPRGIFLIENYAFYEKLASSSVFVFNLFCDARLSCDAVLRSPHFIFGKERD